MKYEGSKADKDRGMKEGSKADMARDKAASCGPSKGAKLKTWSANIHPQKPVGKTHG